MTRALVRSEDEDSQGEPSAGGVQSEKGGGRLR